MACLTLDENGKGTIELRNGQKATIEGISTGSTYTVKETKVGATVITEQNKDDVDGYATPEAQTRTTVGDTSIAKFTNTYHAAGNVTLHAKKKLLKGDEVQTLQQGQFKFTLTSLNSAVPVNETVTNDANGNVDFTALNFTEADMIGAAVMPNGTRTKVLVYYVTESDGELSGFNYGNVTYDAAKTIMLRLTDDGQGHITVTSNLDEFTAHFTNHYELKAPAHLEANKELTGRDIGNTYYVFETDSTGTRYEANSVHNGYTVTYGTQEVTISASNNTASVTNNRETTSVKVRKVWIDSNNQDGKRPESVRIQLKADGADSGDVVTLNASNNWTYTWTGLDKYSGSTLITYTVEEVGASGGTITFNGAEYTVSIDQETDQNADTSYVVTNGYTPETVNIPVSKEWVFNTPSGVASADGWPTGVEVTVTLYKGEGEQAVPVIPAQSVILNATNKSASFTGLPKYEGGQLVNYSVVETGITGVDSTKFTVGIVKNNDTGAFTITNTEKKGSLTITKTMVGAALSNLTDAQKRAITFTVTGPNNYTNTIRLYDFTNGSYTINDLPLGAYTVVENNAANNVPDGYTFVSTVYVTANNDDTADTATVTENGTASVTVTNTYTKNTTYTPKVTKVLNQDGVEVTVGDKWPENGFDFTLDFAQNGNPGSGATLDTNTAKATASAKTASFGAITFTKTGTYTFTITETVPTNATDKKLNGITYNDTPITLTVVVGTVENNSHELKITSVLYSPDTTASTTEQDITDAHGTIVNTYDVTPTTYTPKVQKTFTNGDGHWPEGGFTFTLTADRNNIANGAAIAQGGNTATVRTNSNPASFGTITFSKAGTYTFTVQEDVPAGAVNNLLNGIKYDGTQHTVVVEVTDNNRGALSVTKVTVDSVEKTTNDDIVAAHVSATNTYTTVRQHPSGTKVLIGRDWQDNETFSFTLTPNDATLIGTKIILPAADTGTTTGVITKTVSKPASGNSASFDFPDITFRDAGTYVFTMQEVNGGTTTVNGLVYDGKAVTVTITVTNTEGVLSVSDPDYAATGVTENVNTWTNEQLTSIRVTKQWKNADGNAKTIADGADITFTLYQSVNGSATEIGTGTVKYGKNGSHTLTGTQLGAFTDGETAVGWGTTTINGLPLVDSSNHSITYYVVETVVDDTIITYKAGENSATETASSAAVSSGIITIINQDAEATVNVVKKDATGTTPLSGAVFTLTEVQNAAGTAK